MDDVVVQARQDGGLMFTQVGGRRQAAFYRLTFQLTLWGGEDLVREWGSLPVGRAPNRLVEHHPSPAALAASLRRHIRERLRHGYRMRGVRGRQVH